MSMIYQTTYKKQVFKLIQGLILYLLFTPVGLYAQSSNSDTLEVVNWNLEFFGDTPSDLPEEMSKTLTIMNAIDADIYALVEIVNIDSLASLVGQMDGDYSFVVSGYGSLAPSPTSNEYPEAQKLAFVYRNELVRSVSAQPLLVNSIYAYGSWSSGRFPFLISAEVKGHDGIWQWFRFVVIHAKAGSDFQSCARRLSGARELKDSLDVHLGADKVIILGDFNDDFDTTICSSYSKSTFSGFVEDSLDANSWFSPTLSLSRQGVSTIYGYNSFIDHVLISNELKPYYAEASARVLEAEVNTWVTQYRQDVSDHYPVITKYRVATPTGAGPLNTSSAYTIYPNPAADYVTIKHPHETTVRAELRDLNSRVVYKGVLKTGVRTELPNLQDGLYLLILYGKTGSRTVHKLQVLNR